MYSGDYHVLAKWQHRQQQQQQTTFAAYNRIEKKIINGNLHDVETDEHHNKEHHRSCDATVLSSSLAAAAAEEATAAASQASVFWWLRSWIVFALFFVSCVPMCVLDLHDWETGCVHWMWAIRRYYNTHTHTHIYSSDDMLGWEKLLYVWCDK